ncbi:MAG: sulfite exporter TauE/SafE family protein [Bdellovibrionales bacterium]
MALGAGLLAAGFSSTLVSTMLGAGGGLIAIPVLQFIFMQVGLSSADAMVMTVGTAAFAMMLTGPRAMAIYMKRDQLDWGLAKQLFFPTVLGCWVAYLFGLTGSGELMKIVFAVLVTLIGLFMLFGGEKHYLTKERPGNLVWWGFAFILGIICSLVGIGGGIIAVPLMAACHVPLRRAIGTSAIITCAVGFMSFLTYMQIDLQGVDMPFTIGSVHILAAILFFLAGYVGMPVGAWLQQKFTSQQLRYLFATVLFCSAARFFWLIFAT